MEAVHFIKHIDRGILINSSVLVLLLCAFLLYLFGDKK